MAVSHIRSDALSDICNFCAEVSGWREHNLFFDLGLVDRAEDYVLAANDSFIVVPCIGALTDWYLLVVSRNHVLSTGHLGPGQRVELRHTLQGSADWLKRRAGTQHVAVFEHGSYSFRDKGGACYDHAHVHVVATDRPLAGFIGMVRNEVELRPADDWIEEAHRHVQDDKRSYLAVAHEGVHLVGDSGAAKSQFFRRYLNQWLGGDETEWDFAVHPRSERAAGMIAAGGEHPLVL